MNFNFYNAESLQTIYKQAFVCTRVLSPMLLSSWVASVHWTEYLTTCVFIVYLAQLSHCTYCLVHVVLLYILPHGPKEMIFRAILILVTDI